MRTIIAAGALLALAGCTTLPKGSASSPVEVKIIAFNDFHGALEPPRFGVPATDADGKAIRVPAGGAAYFASAIAALKAANPNHAVVSAGDLISASPLISSYYLDEPTILAMNMIGIDFNAVGNHEFDRGRAELLRMQNGGCARHTHRDPCAVDPDFPGADFAFLAANVRTEDKRTIFPSYGIRTFGNGDRAVRVAFIGLTLKATPTLVSPGGVAGLSFDAEADSINALVPALREEGADAIVVLIHQGLSTRVGYNDKSCAGMDGDLMPVLARLDPAIDLVVSGHTHNAYVCDYGTIDPARPFLVTSAGRSGTLLTDITLSINPLRNDVVARRADNVIVQSEGFQSSSGAVPIARDFAVFQPEPKVAGLVARYAAAAEPIARRPVGRFSAPASREVTAAGESVLGALIADAHLAATRAPDQGGAQIAFSNSGGLRADIVPGPDGVVTYGQLVAAQPFGNVVMVKSFTGAELRAVLEQQFNSGSNSVTAPNMLMPSRGFAFSYDLSRPAGQRIVSMTLDGAPIREDALYRVAVNNFLANGGDNFTIFAGGRDPIVGGLDVDVLEAYIASAGTVTPPAADRITRLSR